MRVGKVLEAQQPKEYSQSNKRNKQRRGNKEEHLSFNDVMELMGARSYKRHKGALRQK